MTRDKSLTVASWIMLVAAVYHTVGIFYPLDDVTPLRHTIFVGICGFCAWGLRKRPDYFTIIFGVLTIQQFYSHVISLYRTIVHDKRIPFLDAGVLIFMAVVLSLLFQEADKKKQSTKKTL